MATDFVERRLAAVVAADVAGYSRLMGIEEEDTLARLKAARKAVVDPAIAFYRGRIVKTTGDGLLVEFASAVDAVRSAVEVQRSMADQNGAMPKDQRIEFRVVQVMLDPRRGKTLRMYECRCGERIWDDKAASPS